MPSPSPMSPSTLSTLPPFVNFLIFFYFALCCRKQWQTIVHHCDLLCVALVQKTMMNNYIVRNHLLCVVKLVLICHTFMLMLNLFNFFARFFYIFNPKPNSCTLRGSSFNARWAWRWNKREQMGSWRLKRVLQGECMH
jgi:hypothetical protein